MALGPLETLIAATEPNGSLQGLQGNLGSFYSSLIQGSKHPYRRLIVQKTLQVAESMANLAALTGRFADAGESHQFLVAATLELDLRHFHIEIRILYDKIAELLNASARKKMQLYDSFSKLMTKLQTDPERIRQLLGDQVTQSLSNQSHFELFRDLRDRMVHHGAAARVFPNTKDGLSFTVRRSEFRKILIQLNDFSSILEQNENYVIRTDRYLAICIAIVVQYVESLIDPLASLLSMPNYRSFRGSLSFPNVNTIRKWAFDCVRNLAKDSL